MKSELFSTIRSIMETKRLKQFCLIVETGSLAKASELLFTSHSALSKSMRLLQEEVGLTLFRPAGRGIAATTQGLEFYQRAKEFLEHEHRLLQVQPKENSSILKIGAVEIFIASLSDNLQNEFLQAHSISLLEMDPGNIEQSIVKREIDYGITYIPNPMDSLDIIEIGKFRMGCYFLNGAFDNVDISNIPFVVPPRFFSSNPFGIQERDGWLDSIYPRYKKYFVNQLSTAIDFTLKGICAVYMPEFIAHSINRARNKNSLLLEYPLPKKHRSCHRAFLLKHKDHTDNKVQKHILQLMKKIVSNS